MHVNPIGTVASGGNQALTLCAQLRRKRCVEQPRIWKLSQNVLLLHSKTPICLVASSETVVHCLLASGADVNHQDAFGNIVLMGAATAALVVFEALLRRGANASIKSTAGKSLCVFLREWEKNYAGMKFKDIGVHGVSLVRAVLQADRPTRA